MAEPGCQGRSRSRVRLHRVEPVTHDPGGLLGLRQVHGMAPARDQRRDAVRDETGHAERMRRRSGCRPTRPGPERGQGSVGRRSHRGSWVPVPHRRRLDARPGGVLRSRSARCAASPTASRSNSGPRSHASTNPSTSPEASSSSARLSSERRRRARSAGSSMPAVTPMKTTPRRVRSPASATCRATRAPSE